ncbi:uncharacterized protein BDW47DRAFT_103276 [Aspergillus candidus]|uniref:DUF7704 domain-containing protein n=1 Tax=Aspergillus candidus TaxID=41067 RepID=A0A2I2FF52_ASPCN|nr:hypothetical protein BDW47DRAFT_103276 [Aspergillus candidus]PLB39235.1 hypothetical protein BDW47DRAFT_103276 [Aspergillus candidus]
MPTTILPTWPHILFAVLEPLSGIGGWVVPFNDGLTRFILEQVPSVAPPETIHPSSVALAGQLVNLYGLLAVLCVGIVYSTNEPKVLRNYLACLCFSDVGHIYANYVAMGPEAFLNVQGWNALGWGNIAVTAFLFVNRVLYLLGVFGYAQAPKASLKQM